MTVIRYSVHTVREGETLDSLVSDYRLSSGAAILDIDKNASVRSQLSADGNLPAGLIIQIPPNAEDILRRRISTLHELRPVLLAHFVTLRELADARLLPALKNAAYPYDSDEINSVLQDLQEFSLATIEHLSVNSNVFVEFARAMSLTHVASSDDHELVASSGFPSAGLVWAVSRDGIGGWEALWTRDLLDGRWNTDSSKAAAKATMDLLTTIQSVVIQRLDGRLREGHRLQQRLQAE